MEKEELLSILLNNINCFNGVSEMDFYFLAIIDTNELGLINDKVARVTPLLKQITDYALVNVVLTKEQMESIECCFNENDTLFKESIDLIDACHKYIITLIDENCHHPSILTSDNLTKGLTLYNEFNEILGTIIEMTDGDFQDNLIDLGHIVDDRISDIIDDKLDDLLNRLRSGFINNKKELILSMTNFSKNILNTVMSISKMKSVYIMKDYYNTLYIDDNYIHISDNNKITSNSDITMLNFLNTFVNIIGKVDEYKNEGFDEDINSLIENLKEVYFLYKTYKYEYLKNNYRERRLLEKCKKL